MLVGEREHLEVGRAEPVHLPRGDGRLQNGPQRGRRGREDQETLFEGEFEPTAGGRVPDLVDNGRRDQASFIRPRGGEERLPSREEGRCVQHQAGDRVRHHRSASASRSAAVMQEFARSIVSEQTTSSTPAAAR